jgi:chitin disaccharide deacetylase
VTRGDGARQAPRRRTVRSTHDPAPRRLIVNADDLGRSTGINDGIFEAHARGLVTSATLMAGEAAAGDAAARLADHPKLGVGLHITLTGSRPTLPARRVPSLVDAAGNLPRKPELIDRFEPGEVLAEVEHQIELFRDLIGRLPTHLDSHHHSHRHPIVLEAVVQVAKRYRLPVRRASGAVAERLHDARLFTTSTFVESFFGEGVSLEHLLEVVSQLPEGTAELMCHPGYADAALRRESGYADERDREIRVLCDPAARSAIRAAGVELVTFAALGAR